MTRDLGVNLAGVEVILEMRRKLEELRKENQRLADYIHREVRREVRRIESRGLGAAGPRRKGQAGRVSRLRRTC